MVFFDDIRKDEWTPSYTDGASKMDYLLLEIETAVEVKKSRQSLTAKLLGEELLIDIAKYQKHPQCRKLVCFVYDPEGTQRIIRRQPSSAIWRQSRHAETWVTSRVIPRTIKALSPKPLSAAFAKSEYTLAHPAGRCSARTWHRRDPSGRLSRAAPWP